MLQRASALVPALRERSAHAEQLRRLPDDNVADLLASGVYRIGVPRRFGGFDVDYAVCVDVAEELGRGCPSTGWCYGVWVAHAWLIGYWPLLAQEEVLGANPDALIASSLNIGRSTCTPVDGGYRVSGRWEFSSGCDFSGWVMLGVPGIGERNWALIPDSDFEIEDTWFVSGLRATGSKDIVVHDAFVPSHRILDVATAGDGDYSGWELHQQVRYRAPVPTLLGWDLVAPMLGIGQGMIDEFIARLSGTSGPGRTPSPTRSTSVCPRPQPRLTPPGRWSSATSVRSSTGPRRVQASQRLIAPGTVVTKPSPSNSACRRSTRSSTSAAATPSSIPSPCNDFTAMPTPSGTATP